MASGFDLNADLPAEEEAPHQEEYLFDLNEPLLDMEEEVGHHTTAAGLQTPINVHNQLSRTRLNSEKRVHILMRLLHLAREGALKRNSIQSVLDEFNVSRRTTSRIWSTAKQQIAAQQRPNVSTKYHNCGKKGTEVDPAKITAIHMGDRSCIRDLASKLEISKSTTHRLIKRGIIRPHSNALKPGLKDANKTTRMQWILSLLQGGTPESKRKYYPMYDFVHIDEKWFQLSKKSQKVYLAQNERGMYRAASSSKFIPKVMFTAAVARPRFNSEGHCTFDGKIGIFPFTYQEAAKRSSKNRDKGTVVTKLVELVNQKVTRSMLINQIVPSIKAKWPQDGGVHKVIFIQQDNAKAHICQEDPEWQQVYNQDEFTFILTQQPPNSPDLNILDLGFFRSIQSLMHKKMPKNIDAMLEAVEQAFYELDPTTLSNVWYSLQFVMNEILKVKGCNDYDLPHVNKKKLLAQNDLPIQIEAPMWVVIESWNLVNGNAQGSQANQATSNADQGTQSTMEHQDSQEDVDFFYCLRLLSM